MFSETKISIMTLNSDCGVLIIPQELIKNEKLMTSLLGLEWLVPKSMNSPHSQNRPNVCLQAE